MRTDIPLSEYNKKRNFGITAEPKGKAPSRNKKPASLQFVVQKHGARRLHYDFRLELDGVMKSWAVTKGPSYDPSDKRLAVETEDHPIEYNKFEGVIPDKQYGGGPVMIWDKGFWEPEGDPYKGLKKGHLVFTLHGSRLKGRWHLVLMRGKDEKRNNWLMIKGDDEFSRDDEPGEAFLERENTSVISGRTLDQIRENTSAVPKNTGKPSTKLKKLQTQYGDVALATLVDAPPSGGQWLHEIKYDGYRLLAFIENGKVILQTRGKQDWTHKFSRLASDLARLKVTNAVLDGEAVVLDDKGTSNFSALQVALSEGSDAAIEGWFFDLLYLNNQNYSKKPLSERKKALKKVLGAGKKSSVHYSDHFPSTPGLLEKACQMGAEGIVSKNKDAPYRGRRSHDWVKSKCGLEQEFVIGGYMPAKDNPKAVGALLLGYYKGKDFLYAGKVGTGFSAKTARLVYERLKPLSTADSPFEGRVEKGRRGYVWVKPSTVCEVSFWEWTSDKHIRHASFKGLREDKAPKQVHEEIPEKTEATKPARAEKKKSSGAYLIEGITITHPDREIFPGTGITKGDHAAYLARASGYMLPYIENRLISLVRCTETIEGECFFQRAPMKGGKGNVHGFVVNHKGSKHNYMYIDSAAGIIELAQMGAMEFHAWQSRVTAVSKPDQMIFDLDPAGDVPFEAVKLAAEDVRQRLKRLGLVSFPRLTGGKGVHVTVPLLAGHEWEAVKAFTRSIAQQMENDAPDAYIATMSKQKRTGKIFVDYLRNDFSATGIVPFSLRARPNAPVAVPLSWNELKKIENAAQYNFLNVEKKLGRSTEKIIAEFFESRQKLKIE